LIQKTNPLSEAALPQSSPAARFSVEQLLDLYRWMVLSREIDAVEQELTSRGEAFFHVSGAGHEASAALAFFLTDDDWLHCHYRDKALLLARGMTPRNFFDSLFCKDGSESRGRQMSAHLSDASRKILSLVGPVGNNALQAVGVAAAVKDRPGSPIVLCAVGDGTTQQGEFLEAVAEAVRSRLPALFFVEDNQWAISTKTPGQTFYSRPDGKAKEFYGIPIVYVDGRDAIGVAEALEPIVNDLRETREPAIVVMEVERLSNHTNADDQRIYRSEDEILAAGEAGDPIRRLEERLFLRGCSESRLEQIRQECIAEVRRADEESFSGPDPEPTFDAKAPIAPALTAPESEYRGDEANGEYVMRDALRETLKRRLATDARVTLFGQDIEDPKGDVFGVTKGLSTKFGRRVRNAPLAESTIVGVSIGRALAGERPVAFLQFADFFPIAFNQIVSELGSIHWRTDGAWSAPVIVMVACGAYRPGLGPFHAQSFEAVAAHTPGVDVFMPSTAADAAGMLNAAFESGRPTLFFYPKSCLNDAKRKTSSDVEKLFTPIGAARKVRSGRDLTLIGWGNAVRLCERAADDLEGAGVEAEIIDLRSISPWDKRTVLASAQKTGKVIVVHEDNETCGMGAEILATVAERCSPPPRVRRLARPDTFVPCNFANQIAVLPSYERLLTAAAEMVDLDLTWIRPEAAAEGTASIEAIGSGPSDETVLVVDLLVREEQTIERGQPVATLEATKSVFELTSPMSGKVKRVLAAPGETVAVGAPLFQVAIGTSTSRSKPITQENPGRPVLVSRKVPAPASSPAAVRGTRVGLACLTTAVGSRTISNRDLLEIAGPTLAGRIDPEEIVRKTGIESRPWAEPTETVVELGVRAVRQALAQADLAPESLDLLICATTTPDAVTPSVACKILQGLAGPGRESALVAAYDINAACSGYLYALQAAYDFLTNRPDAKVMVVTSEVLSPLLNLSDPDTAIIFGDAASASLLVGDGGFGSARMRIYRPELSAKGDAGEALKVPFAGHGFVQMRGRTVFTEAVRAMISGLRRACEELGTSLDDLRLIVPHQANQRIIDAIQSRVGASVYSNIRDHGNTSSTSIPLCLADLEAKLSPGDRIGLCAFGGGFTFGAGILEKLEG
jgi:2-oxoisovalerate dehydrogenase E1 component